MKRAWRKLTSDRSQMIIALGILQLVVLGIGWVLGWATHDLLTGTPLTERGIR